jgi:hypothetical protein
MTAAIGAANFLNNLHLKILNFGANFKHQEIEREVVMNKYCANEVFCIYRY